MLAKNTRDKYRKNKKCNKNQDLETEEAKRGPEMSPSIAKIAKVTRIFLAMWKDWATNMAKIARITNLTKYLRKRKGQEGLRDVRKFRKNRKSNKNFSCHWFFLDLLSLPFLRYLSWVFSASKKNPCYFCNICGPFGVLLSFFFSKYWFLLAMLFLRYL